MVEGWASPGSAKRTILAKSTAKHTRTEYENGHAVCASLNLTGRGIHAEKGKVHRDKYHLPMAQKGMLQFEDLSVFSTHPKKLVSVNVRPQNQRPRGGHWSMLDYEESTCWLIIESSDEFQEVSHDAEQEQGQNKRIFQRSRAVGKRLGAKEVHFFRTEQPLRQKKRSWNILVQSARRP